MWEWKDIPWRKLERIVFKLQKRIYRASVRGDVKALRRLQKTLIRSNSARCIAVRRVTQDNQGKQTAGVDGRKNLTPKQRLDLVNTLKLGDKATPTRRVWIPKPGSKEKRGLGIPTIKERARQALVKLALEPEWEARFEPNSYGFRPGRSCHDAIGQIYLSINKKAKYVLDADIAKCFDRIDHQALLTKMNTFPTIRRQVRAWLKAGVMDGKELFPTTEGTPQGGVLSPLLANIALHGMEQRIKQAFKRRQPKVNGVQVDIPAPDVVRYADDFVILHEDITVIQTSQQVVSEWLLDMGLELKPSKTRITHTLYEYESEKPGFDFLGFSIRQYPVGKYQSGKSTNGKLLGFKTLIKPSKEKQKIHQQQIARIIDAHKCAPQAALIGRLNPVIRGWANYYAAVVSKKTYERQDNLMYSKLRAWANRRHSNKTQGWVNRKYWQTLGEKNWVFAAKSEDTNLLRLLSHKETPIVRHVKIKGTASPYDGDLVYWSSRMDKHPSMPSRVAKLLKKQKGKCAHCNLFFRDEDVIEIDHITPRSQGGIDDYKNLQALHRHCHDLKTALDAKVVGMLDKHQVIEEPDEVKVSCPVLKTSQTGDSLA